MAIYVIQFYPPSDGVPLPLSHFKEEKFEANSYIDAVKQFYEAYDDICPEIRRIYKWLEVKQETLERIRNEYKKKAKLSNT